MVLIINTFPFAEACHARFDGPNCPREIPNPTRRNAPRAISNPTRRKSPSGNSNTTRLRLVVFELPSWNLWSNTSSILRRGQGIYNRGVRVVLYLKDVFFFNIKNKIKIFFVIFKLILITYEIFAHPLILDSDLT